MAPPKRKKNTYFTLMLVPEGGKRISSLKFAWQPLKTVLIILAVVVVGAGLMSVKHWHAYQELLTRITRLNELEKINREQAREIQKLIDESETLKEKMAAVEALDRQVREMVGLELPQQEEIPSRAGDASLRAAYELRSQSGSLPSRGALSAGLDRLDEVSHDLSSISNQVNDQVEKLEKLKNDVDGRLKFLEALPSQWPVLGKITSGYGYRASPFGGGREYHDGIDLKLNYGQTVRAAGSGKVVYAGWKTGFGLLIEINHGYGYRSRYGHNSKLLVKEGDYVEKGESIARGGSSGRSTGSHLHFSVVYNGKTINPRSVLE